MRRVLIVGVVSSMWTGCGDAKTDGQTADSADTTLPATDDTWEGTDSLSTNKADDLNQQRDIVPVPDQRKQIDPNLQPDLMVKLNGLPNGLPKPLKPNGTPNGLPAKPNGTPNGLPDPLKPNGTPNGLPGKPNGTPNGLPDPLKPNGTPNGLPAKPNGTPNDDLSEPSKPSRTPKGVPTLDDANRPPKLVSDPVTPNRKPIGLPIAADKDGVPIGLPISDDTNEQSKRAADQSTTGSIDPRAAEAYRFVSLVAEMEAHIKSLGPQLATDKNCPPRLIVLEDGQKVYIDPEAEPEARGTGTDLFLSKTRVGHKLVMVKFVQDISTLKYVLGLADDLAFMKALHPSSYWPHAYDIDPSRTEASPGCIARLMVSDRVGDLPLRDLNKAVRPHGPSLPKMVLRVASEALSILKELHSRGLVHGDVHPKNFMFDSELDPAQSLRIIDFGRAEPFLDKHGKPFRDEPKDNGSWNMALLSPWEIQGRRRTRRDDLFRLAETLLRVGQYDSWFGIRSRQLKTKRQNKTIGYLEYKQQYLEMKRGRVFNDRTPPVLREFYRMTLKMKAEDEPQYDVWIRKFNAAASTYT